MAARPMRMCAICRERHDQRTLVRLREAGGSFKLWRSGDKGRSIYICSNECFQQAIKRRFFDRQKALVSKEVTEYFEDQHE